MAMALNMDMTDARAGAPKNANQHARPRCFYRFRSGIQNRHPVRGAIE
jgi:hypothetical protein